MVKFAEAEKRGRGGEGGERRYPPVMVLERPKMSRAMWESLKSHIVKDRKRKKEEQEADAEEERLRKERENRKKQHAMTLEETRDTIVKMEQGLSDLKNQKHQLFQELKVVLNEDATRKRAQQQSSWKENEMVLHSYPHGAIPMTGHPQMLFQSNLVPGRSTLPLHSYKVPQPQPQPLIPTGSLKRPHTPSPPQPASYQQISYNFKNIPGHPAPNVPVTLPTTKAGGGSSVYVTGQAPYYHGTSQPHTSSTQYQTSSQAAAAAYLSSGAPSLNNPPPPSQPPPPSSREDKHLQPVYMQSSRATHVSALHQPLDHKGKPSAASFLPPGEGGQDKYFPPGVRPHMPLHSGVLPVQQQHPGGGKGGSITSGFPVRSAPPTSQPSPVVSSAAHISKTDAKPRYSNQPPSYSRTYY